jgi:hypothetical protein
MTVKEKKKENYEHLLSLPAQKELLDFIKNKICIGSSPEKYKFVDELFELHRTSNGFVPHNLIKTRFLRLKASEIKANLIETDFQTGEIVKSDEYKNLYAKFHSGNLLLEKLQQIKSKLETNNYHGIDLVIEDFKSHLQVTDNYQTVLAFYRFFQLGLNKKQISPEVAFGNFRVK